MGYLYPSHSLGEKTVGLGGELGSQFSGPDLLEDHPFIEIFDSLTWTVISEI